MYRLSLAVIVFFFISCRQNETTSVETTSVKKEQDSIPVKTTESFKEVTVDSLNAPFMPDSSTSLSFKLPFVFNEKSLNYFAGTLKDEELKDKKIDPGKLKLETKGKNIRVYKMLDLGPYQLVFCIYEGPYSKMRENREFRLIKTSSSKVVENVFLGGFLQVEEGDFSQFFEISEDGHIAIKDVTGEVYEEYVLNEGKLEKTK